MLFRSSPRSSCCGAWRTEGRCRCGPRSAMSRARACSIRARTPTGSPCPPISMPGWPAICASTTSPSRAAAASTVDHGRRRFPAPLGAQKERSPGRGRCAARAGAVAAGRFRRRGHGRRHLRHCRGHPPCADSDARWHVPAGCFERLELPGSICRRGFV